MMTEQERAEFADLVQTVAWQDNVIRDMGAKLEIDLRTLAALASLRERWGKKADQLRVAWASSSDLRQAATLDACAFALGVAVAGEVPSGGVS